MTPETRTQLEELRLELESDVRQSRTRDEAMRLTRRTLRLDAILAAAALTQAPLTAAQ